MANKPSESQNKIYHLRIHGTVLHDSDQNARIFQAAIDKNMDTLKAPRSRISLGFGSQEARIVVFVPEGKDVVKDVLKGFTQDDLEAIEIMEWKPNA